MGDIEAMGDNIDVAGANGSLAHELNEQVVAQRTTKGNVNSLSYEEADNIHNQSIANAENPTNGSTRTDYARSTNAPETPGPDRRAANGVLIQGGKRNGNIDINYSKGNATTTVSIEVKNNNIIGVKVLK